MIGLAAMVVTVLVAGLVGVVKACNSHERLVETLKEISNRQDSHCSEEELTIILTAREALAEAGEA